MASNRFAATFTGSDADAFIHREHEDFPVADLTTFAGAAAFDDGRDGRLHEVVVDSNLKLHFAEKVYRDLVTTIGFGMATLPPETLHIEDRKSKDFHFRQRFLHTLELVRLNDGNDEFQKRSFAEVEKGPPRLL